MTRTPSLAGFTAYGRASRRLSGTCPKPERDHAHDLDITSIMNFADLDSPLPEL